MRVYVSLFVRVAALLVRAVSQRSSHEEEVSGT
jgi:hypothetical protein